MRAHASLEALASYFDKPDSERPIARYVPERLDDRHFFEAEQLARLERIVKTGASLDRHGLARFLIDLSWASSRLEGSTYTQIDTQSLIDYGRRNPDKPAEDAVMVLNHKRAIEIMLSDTAVSLAQAKAIHAALADGTHAPESRHFLEAHQRGQIRSYTPNGLWIGQTSYLPPQAEDRPPGFIDHEVERLINGANEITHPIERAFYLMTRLPYLQPFYDANKRTSRVLANAPLLAEGFAPISFVDFDKSKYLQGIVAFYELGDEQLFGNAFLDAYISSALRYRPLPESDRVAFAIDRERIVNALRAYVLLDETTDVPAWILGDGNEHSSAASPRP